MSHLLKNLYDNLVEPVLLFDNKKETFFSNTAFNAVFGRISDLKGLKKLEYRFSFEVCLLESDEITTYTPISSALSSKYNFSCYCVFQKSESERLHYVLKALTIKNWRIIYFYDITKNLLFEKINLENQNLKIQNNEFLKTNVSAQNQAVKMALLNRVATSLRSSMDLKSLIDTALSELSNIFGAKKLYFVKTVKDGFEIEQVFPLKYKKEIGDNLNFDSNILSKISNAQTLTDIVLQENNSPLTRIILPIIEGEILFGIIVIFTQQKIVSKAENELLKSVLMQISSAILKTNLFEKIRNQKEELERALNDLKETQIQLINSEKMASLGQLIASVAHEINTPLASISANNEILAKFFENSENPIINEIGQIDREAIKRITNIVKSLKRFVRLDEETRQEANINQELDLTLTLLRQRTKNSINIVKKYENVPLISCFPNMLNQVFLNILMNAIQSIEQSKKNGEITIETGLKDDFLCIKITDNGAGIKETDKCKIFNAGFTTKKVGEGTGLGLAICKKIIDEHKGQISFKSAKNSGTTFEILIPYA